MATQLIAMFSFSCLSSAAVTPELYLLDDSADPLAVCNDGTKAGYYYLPARPGLPGSRRWSVFLEYGMWCWDEFSCQERNRTRPFFMMGGVSGIELADWRATFNVGDDFYSDDMATNPDFAGAHAVYVPYCSSDAWSGDTGASNETFGWHFRGKRIVTEVLKQLHRQHGLGNDTETFLLTGTSAGGAGVLTNADDVSEMIKQFAPQARFAGEMNAGWFVDIPSMSHCQQLPDCPEDDPSLNPTSPGDQFRLGMALWAGRPNKQCTMAFGEKDAWRCYLGESGYPFVTSRLMVTQSQTDCWPLAWAGAAPVPTQDAPDWCAVDTQHEADGAKKFAMQFRQQIAAQLGEIAGDNALFSPVCYLHEVAWHQHIVNDVASVSCTRAQVLGDWLFERSSSCGPRVLDTCEDMECTTACIVAIQSVNKYTV